MKPCPAEAAAVACESLADAMDRGRVGDRYRKDIAAAVYWVPNAHPMRQGDDEVLRMARAIEAGNATQATQDSLRAFAARLREGAPAMRATGWYATFYGPDSMDARGES